jgi:hypothetical protein
MRSKNIIPLVQYSHPEETITRQMRKEANDKFYKRLSCLKSSMVRIKKITPFLKIKKCYSLPKLNIHLNNINNSSNDKISSGKEKNKITLSTRDKNNKFLTFEERMILNFYENAISQRMRAKPKRINDMFFKQFKSNFQKSKENYRKIDEMRLIKENSIYKKGIKRYSGYYANFSNKYMDKSLLGLRNKIRLKII